jgi:hypothetical protein
LFPCPLISPRYRSTFRYSCFNNRFLFFIFVFHNKRPGRCAPTCTTGCVQQLSLLSANSQATPNLCLLSRGLKPFDGQVKFLVSASDGSIEVRDATCQGGNCVTKFSLLDKQDLTCPQYFSIHPALSSSQYCPI